MSYSITDRFGGTDDNPSPDTFYRYLEELDPEDLEHPDTWMSFEEDDNGDVIEMTLVCDCRGFVRWSMGADSLYLFDVSREDMLELWLKLAQGQIETIEAESWKQKRDG